MNDLPAHILDKLERRWASRLARDAAAWRAEQPPHAHPAEIVDRAGRHVPVASDTHLVDSWGRGFNASPKMSSYAGTVGLGGWAVRG